MSALLPSVVEQRTAALATANQARMDGADFKREMGALTPRRARARAAAVLRFEPDSVGAMRVHAFLECLPGVGDAKARRWLVCAQVWPLKRVRELTDRQRL